jgi:fatty acid desaturase
VWQIINSFGPYFILSYLMYRSLDVSYWITLALALLGAGFQVRTFIIFHDCCHGSFFKSQRANDIVGIVKWFSGNIGFHHIHHLNPYIPNYTLIECQKEVPIFWSVKPITLLSSMRSLTLRLWDEERRVPVGFDYLKT